MKISLTTILSFVPAIALLLFGVFYVTNIVSWGELPRVIAMFNLPSLAIIIGGVLTHEMISFPPKQVYAALGSMRYFFSHNMTDSNDLQEEIPLIIGWQKEIRRNKLASASSFSAELGESFEGYIFMLMATNYSIEEIKELGEARIASNYRKNSDDSKIFASMGNVSPAFGMLGTLLGLILMLQNFQDTMQLGTGLGLALMTTLYGLAMTQFLWGPMEKKINHSAMWQARREQLILEGILLIMKEKPAMYIKDYLNASIQ